MAEKRWRGVENRWGNGETKSGSSRHTRQKMERRKETWKKAIRHRNIMILVKLEIGV